MPYDLTESKSRWQQREQAMKRTGVPRPLRMPANGMAAIADYVRKQLTPHKQMLK